MRNKLLILIIALLLATSSLSTVGQEQQEQDEKPLPLGVGISEAAQTFYEMASNAGMFYIDLSAENLPAARKSMEALGAMVPPLRDVSIQAVDAGGVPAEWFIPPEGEDKGIILYTHGGGYVLGAVASYRGMLSQLAAFSGLRVLAIEYRLAPEHPFPAAVEDSTAAYRWLLAQGIAPERIALAGDSAGGGLAAATLLALRDAGDPLPAAAVLFSPFADMTGSGATINSLAEADPLLTWEGSLGEAAAAYVGEADPRDPLASPIYGDFQGLPPLLVMVGTNEILLSDSTRLARQARLAGVDVTLDVWEGMVHVWPLFGVMLPESRATLVEVGAFIQEHVTP